MDRLTELRERLRRARDWAGAIEQLEREAEEVPSEQERSELLFQLAALTEEIVPERDFRQTQDPRYLLQWYRGVDGPRFGMTYIEGLGGGSGFFEMVALRAPSQAFDQEWRGRRLWPAALDRSAMDPWYQAAEQMMHVRQVAPEAVPASGRVFALLLDRLGYSCERSRNA